MGIAFTQPRLQRESWQFNINTSVHDTSCVRHRTLHPTIGKGNMRALIGDLFCETGPLC